MSSPIKGYSAENKENKRFEYVTVQRVNEQRHGMEAIVSMYAQSIASDAVEAGSTSKVIVATAHVALPGDSLSFTSGAFNTYEIKVDSVDTNTITLAQELPADPAVADTFDILRHKIPAVDASGNVSFSPGPIQFIRDAVNQQVIEDTVTPANNRPLPVKLTGFTGDVAINAANLNLEVQLSDQGANADVVRIGDGTDQLGIYVEDAASAGGETGPVILAVRNSAAVVTTSNDGDFGTLTIDDTGQLRVAATITEQAVFAEDSAHTTGDDGKFILAVRNDALSSLVDTDGDYAPLQVDANGLLKVSATITETAVFAEDSAHTTGDDGKFILAVRNDALASLVDTDGDYAPLQVDANGLLKVSATVTESAIFAEDSAHTTGDDGKFILGVRNDASAVFTTTDGDYSPIAVDSSGRPKVIIEGSLPAGTNNIGDVDILSVIPGTGATNLGKAEDAAHTSGDVGVMALAVRSDAGGPFAADGDYVPLSTNATGELRVAATITESAVFAEDSAHTTGDNGKFILAVRNDAAAAFTSTDGDYSPLAVDMAGRAKVVVDTAAAAAGRSKVDLIRNDYSSVNVTTAAYVQLVASTAADINLLDVFDSSGQTLVFAVGAAAAEVDQFYIYPGGNGRVELSIPSGSRLSVKAVSATASVGELDINTFS